jgi:hypothetical protein
MACAGNGSLLDNQFATNQMVRTIFARIADRHDSGPNLPVLERFYRNGNQTRKPP